MKEETNNIRLQFDSLKMAFRELYKKNTLDMGKAVLIKEFVLKIDRLKNEYETELLSSIMKINNKEKIAKPKIVLPIIDKSRRIILKSEKGKKIEGEHKCDECDMVRKPVYKYSKSNVGEVYVCNECKIQVFNRSFGSIGPKGENLIGKNIKSGGAWESNRSKH